MFAEHPQMAKQSEAETPKGLKLPKKKTTSATWDSLLRKAPK
jgi:hypothetical protein